MILIPLLIAASSAAAVPPPDDPTLYARLRDRVAAAYDSSRGGFVPKSEVPSEAAVELGLVLGEGDPGGAWTRHSMQTIAWTRGLLDTVGGGYLHAARDARMDNFEKRTDTNARRLENLVLAWQMTGDEAQQRDARRVIDFFERVLLDGRGGFVAGQVGDRELQPLANGLAIHAWLRWAAATSDGRYRDFALRSLDRVWETCLESDFGLMRKGTFGEVMDVPQLLDQVEMGRALVLASHLCGRDEDRARAIRLGDLVLAAYEDGEKGGGFRTQSVPNKKGGFKKADRVSEENARAALFLCELSTLTGDAKYRDAAKRAWRAFDEELSEGGLAVAEWALALRAAVEPETPETPAWAKQKVAAQEPTGPKKSFRIKLGRR